MKYLLVRRYNLSMRSLSEMKLLSIRQRLMDALNEVLSSPVVDLEMYRHLSARLAVCREILIECRKQNLTKTKPKMRGIR